MNLLEINTRMRQRPPFQMIERVTELDPGKSATGIKCVSVNEPYFEGHMPGYPIMPGVLLIETCAQLCSLVIEQDGIDDSRIYVLLKVKDFKFVKAVIPGDRLEIRVECVRGGTGLMSLPHRYTAMETCVQRGICYSLQSIRKVFTGKTTEVEL